MQIYKMADGSAMMLLIGDITIHFTHYEKHLSGVNLLDGERLAAALYFDQATEFYKAWRAL